VRGRPAVRIIFSPFALGVSGRTVRLDPRTPNVAKRLLRALIHIEHPAWSKGAIRTTASARWAVMTLREKAELYRMLGSAKLEGER